MCPQVNNLKLCIIKNETFAIQLIFPLIFHLNIQWIACELQCELQHVNFSMWTSACELQFGIVTAENHHVILGSPFDIIIGLLSAIITPSEITKCFLVATNNESLTILQYCICVLYCNELKQNWFIEMNCIKTAASKSLKLYKRTI